MLSGSFLIFAGLALTSITNALALQAAAPTCANNDCLKIVKQNKRAGGNVGCTAFLRKTVTPKTVTTTISATVTQVVKSKTTSYSTLDSTIQPVTTVPTTELDTITSTVTSTTTSTSTVTSTSDPFRIRRRAKNTNTPVTSSQTVVPTYASAVCNNIAAYSSACSCIGVTPGTTTALAPITTKFVTKTQTSTDIETDVGTTTVYTTNPVNTVYTTTTRQVTTTTTVTVAAIPTSFALQLQSSKASLDGTYLWALQIRPVFTMAPKDIASSFSLDPSGTVQYDNQGTTLMLAVTHLSNNGFGKGDIGLLTPEEVQAEGTDTELLTCQVDATGKFTCIGSTSGSGATWQSCPYGPATSLVATLDGSLRGLDCDFTDLYIAAL